MAWIKQRGICGACGVDSGVICHHCVGSSYKTSVGLQRELIGHAFVLGLCLSCDNLVTRGSHRAFNAAFGKYADLWAKQYADSPVKFDDLTVQGIIQSGR